MKDNLVNILQDLREEIEATIDSDCVSNLRVVERRRLLRCTISLRCKETSSDRKVHPSVQFNVPLEFKVSVDETCISMTIPRAPTISGTEWFNRDTVMLLGVIELQLAAGVIKDEFEFGIEMFGTRESTPDYFHRLVSISN